MEKLIVEENGFIGEKDYHKIKGILNKKNDYLSEHEFEYFNAIFNATPQIFLNKEK